VYETENEVKERKRITSANCDQYSYYHVYLNPFDGKSYYYYSLEFGDLHMMKSARGLINSAYHELARSLLGSGSSALALHRHQEFEAEFSRVMLESAEPKRQSIEEDPWSLRQREQDLQKMAAYSISASEFPVIDQHKAEKELQKFSERFAEIDSVITSFDMQISKTKESEKKSILEEQKEATIQKKQRLQNCALESVSREPLLSWIEYSGNYSWKGYREVNEPFLAAQQFFEFNRFSHFKNDAVINMTTTMNHIKEGNAPDYLLPPI
jgi:hypothetical protein